jgi:hypothetical protein
MDKNKTPLPGDVLKKVIPPLAAWAVAKLLERPQVKAAFNKVDRASQTRARRVRQNAMRNRAWLAAGAAAFIVGVGLIANAARKK